MDELVALREFRADVPEPTRTTVARTRREVLIAVEPRRRHASWRRPSRPLFGFGLAGAAAIVATTALAGAPQKLWDLIGGSSISPSSLSQHDRDAAQALGIPGIVAVDLITELDGRSFYKFQREDGARCFAVGPTGTPRSFGEARCPTDFPSQIDPIADLSAVQTVHGQPPTLLRFEGIAAPNVSSVGIVEPDGTIVRASLAHGAYVGPPSPLPAKEIEAFADDGSVIYSECLLDSGC